MRVLTFAITLLVLGRQGRIDLETTPNGLKYYVSRPAGWVKGRRYPVVVAIEGADRDFKRTAELFARARGKKDFILLVPMVVTGGGPRFRQVASYSYSPSIWNSIEADPYAFDIQGIGGMITEVGRSSGGEGKVYITGFEAGAHTLFAVAFRHPDWLKAAAPIAPNYAGRGMQDGGFSKDPWRKGLPIREFHGSEDPFCNPGKPFYAQWLRAVEEGRIHGFLNMSEQMVKGRGHVWLADEVLGYFSTFQKP